MFGLVCAVLSEYLHECGWLQLDYNFRKTKQAMTLIFAIQLCDI